MQDFDITISAIVQFIDDEKTNNYTKEIFSLDLSNEKIRYVIFSLNKDNSCIVNTFYKGCTTQEKKLDGKDFYSDDEKNGALPEFFREHVLKENGTPTISKRHFLITIGHGAGFGIMTDVVLKDRFRNIAAIFDEKSKKLSGLVFDNIIWPVEKSMRELLFFAVNNFQSNKQKLPRPKDSAFEKNILFEDLHGNSTLIKAYNKNFPSIKYLTSFQLANIVKKEFSKVQDLHQFNEVAPIDLVLQINCFMQSFENGYGLKDIAKYLFASEIGFPLYGISYITLFRALSKDPQINIQDLAEIIKRALIISRSNQQEDQGPVSFSINDLSKYEDAFKMINNIAIEFTKSFDYVINGKKLRSYLFDVREGSVNRDLDEVYLFIDLYNFLFDLQKVLPLNEDLVKLINDALDCFEKCIIKKYSENVSINNRKFPNSFGIFFPKQNYSLVSDGIDVSKQMIDDYLERRILGVFTEHQKWDEFVSLYLNSSL